jgi:hypothetical protein
MQSTTMMIVLLPAAWATGFALRAADPVKGARKAAPRVFELRTLVRLVPRAARSAPILIDS